MHCTQRAARSEAHHQERGSALHVIVEHAHDMGVIEARDRPGLPAKCFDLLA